MLRIHFTGADWERTRLARRADPMWELALSVHQLWERKPMPLLDGWKQRVSHTLRPGGAQRAEASLTLALSPPRGYFPDFLTPVEAEDGFEAGLDAILSTPKARLSKEIGLLGTPGRAVAEVARGSVGALGRSLRGYFDAALAPVWDLVCGAVEEDLRLRTRQLAVGGWGRVFAHLHPAARFAGGVLEIGVWGRAEDSDLHLDGRGLVLIPSYFKEQRQLMVLADPGLPPVLVYPISHVPVAPSARALTALLGRNRAAVLESAVLGATTSEVARRVGISLPAASKHLQVLRAAGLVSSVRERNAVCHIVTTLGRSLLG